MRRITGKTSLLELKARVRADEQHTVSSSDRLVRSVQQSLRVEGYVVAEDVIRNAILRASTPAKE